MKNKTKEQWLVHDGNNNTVDIYDTQEEAVKAAEESLQQIEEYAMDQGEWPNFDQVYVAKITHELVEKPGPEDTLTVELVEVAKSE